MRARRPLAFLAVVATTGCIRVYHPEYRPEVFRTLVQNVSHPVTFVQALAPSASVAAAHPPPRHAVADGGASPSRAAPTPISTPEADPPPPAASRFPSVAETELPRPRELQDAGPHSSREMQVSTTRMGIPEPAEPEGCPLEILDASGLALLRYTQVGLVQVLQEPYLTDPLDPAVRDLVRPRACALGGAFVSIMSSGDVAPPNLPSYASSYAVYGVWREKSLGELASLL
jgi:hypothetical protein